MQVLDTNTFENTIRVYYPRVVGFVSLLHTKSDAEDIAQEVFAYLWKKRFSLSFPDERSLFSWLIRVAKSKSFDVFRKKSRNREVDSLDNIELAFAELCDEDFFETIGRKDLYNRILSYLDELPKSRREVFELAYVSELSAKEISELLNMPIRTVENHLYQSLKFLKEKAKTDKLLVLPILFLIIVLS